MKIFIRSTFLGIIWLASSVFGQPTEYPTVQLKNTKNNKHEINVLAYNIKLLNAPGKGAAPGRKIRAGLIPKYVKDYDVVVFSEAFDSDARKVLLENMKKYGFGYSTCILGSGLRKKRPLKRKWGDSYNQPKIIVLNNPDSFKKDAKFGYNGTTPLKMDGGVIIVSKYPITASKEWIYSHPTKGTGKVGKGDLNWDWFANKGVVYAKVVKDGKAYHVFGTHTQAQYSRMTCDMQKKLHETGIKQMNEMGKFIKGRKIPKGDLVIAAGDFNINEYKDDQKDLFAALKKELNAFIPKLANEKPPYNDMGGDGAKSGDRKPSRIDYVLVVSDFAKPVESFNAFIPFNLDKPWDEEGKYYSLSDHPGMYGYFNLAQSDKDEPAEKEEVQLVAAPEKDDMSNEELEALADEDKVDDEVVAAFENYDGAIDDD